MNIDISRPQAELMIDLLLRELDDCKHVWSHECIPALNELAVKFGMCSEDDFEAWLKGADKS